MSQDEGIVDDDVDKSIHNLTSIGAEAMCKTDDMVLSIMTSKNKQARSNCELALFVRQIRLIRGRLKNRSESHT